jgi:hypothetical protein
MVHDDDGRYFFELYVRYEAPLFVPNPAALLVPLGGAEGSAGLPPDGFDAVASTALTEVGRGY